MSYPYPGYPVNPVQPNYPTAPAVCPSNPNYPAVYPNPYPQTGYPTGVAYPATGQRTEVIVEENYGRSAGNTVVVTDRPMQNTPVMMGQPSTTVIVEENRHGHCHRGGGFSAGVAMGMATEAVIDSLSHHNRHHDHHHDRHRHHHW